MRGARARCFSSVRVQTGVCTVCGLQAPSLGPAASRSACGCPNPLQADLCTPRYTSSPPTVLRRRAFHFEVPILNTHNVEYRKVETLIPYARNPRTHSDEQVARIAASIAEFGWTNPILVDGEHGVIAGHG